MDTKRDQWAPRKPDQLSEIGDVENVLLIWK
jgi:hypothetical protein